ncbi:uncharacterized protein fid isoform X2 [Eurosta solidaginis]
MTKQLTLSSPTTNNKSNHLPNAGSKSTTTSTLMLSPITEPPISISATSPKTQSESDTIQLKNSSDTKLLQRCPSNCTTFSPNPLLINGLPDLTSKIVVSPSIKVSTDTSGRSAALERAYVHDVYEHCEEPTGPIRPRIAQFLNNLEAGSVVCDVGCGNGRYLAHGNNAICTVGVDCCYRLSRVARDKGVEVLMCDNLELPFRDDSFDAVLSLAVVHHFATTERRVSALRELARILRIGGRVIITVWALEQRHRRFESQDVLIPWQPPKIRNLSCSDEEDDDSFLPPYHAYTEDSTNSSRSAGDGDSSSLSSSSPGESCYSFVRRAIQKLAGGRRHPWFLDSWTSKDTKNDSSLDFEDVKDLPIELRRLEDFDDFHDPPLSAGLKSRSLGSILNPPPRQIVRSRSSVPSLSGTVSHSDQNHKPGTQTFQHLQALDKSNGAGGIANLNSVSPTKLINTSNAKVLNSSTSLGRRPKLIKQKQSLYDEYQLPENSFHTISTFNSVNNSVSNNLFLRGGGCYYNSKNNNGSAQAAGSTTNPYSLHQQSSLTARQMMQASLFLRKQSSLNEELMAVNRLREKERVRKRIQKQTSLNEAFLCRSALFSKKLHVIRESFSKKVKTSTGSFEKVTKTGLNKLVHNLSSYIGPGTTAAGATEKPTCQTEQANVTPQNTNVAKCKKYHHHHHHHNPMQQQQQLQQQQTLNLQKYQRHQGVAMYVHEKHSPTSTLQKQLSLGSGANKYAGPVTYCNNPECATTTACYCSTYHYTGCNTFCPTNDINGNKEDKARRYSRESGSDSSKDSSLQSDTSIESEDSFASVIFIPKPEQHQQQLNYQQQHQNSNSSSSNSSSSNGRGNATGGGCPVYGNCCQHKNGTCKLRSQCNLASCITCLKHLQHANQQRLSSGPTSPLIMPCPPTPAHSPAAAQTAVTSPPQTVASVTAAMAILTPPLNGSYAANKIQNSKDEIKQTKEDVETRFNFDEAHIKQNEYIHETEHANEQQTFKEKRVELEEKITRQIVKNLPPIPKFRKQQSLQLIRQNFPIVRRSSGTSTTFLPSIPKLMSLELFNPATDDLDSDSSEASTPNSIDSVISTSSKPNMTVTTQSEQKEGGSEKGERNKNDHKGDQGNTIKMNEQKYCNGELNINNIYLNENDSCPIPPTRANTKTNATSLNQEETDCGEFAEQLNAQLLKKIKDKASLEDCESSEFTRDSSEQVDMYFSASGESLSRKRSTELRELSTIREELRDRRLMLANLSIQPSLQQSPTSSTSSLSSQTRSFTIHEENEDESDERSYSLQLYENCKVSKINYKRNRSYNLNAETAYLLQDDGDIFAEEEEEGEEKFNHSLKETEHKSFQYDLKVQKETATGRNINDIKYGSLESEGNLEKEGNNETKVCDKVRQISHNNRQSTESWGNSNSSTGSLESPSQGGATTHHRYYHVFREGELDALINHHVASLHIVSSYYERASWCVVAEKVQVWTI